MWAGALHSNDDGRNIMQSIFVTASTQVWLQKRLLVVTRNVGVLPPHLRENSLMTSWSWSQKVLALCSPFITQSLPRNLNEWTNCLSVVKQSERQTSHLVTEATGFEFLSGSVCYVVLHIVFHPIFVSWPLFLRIQITRGVSRVGRIESPTWATLSK